MIEFTVVDRSQAEGLIGGSSLRGYVQASYDRLVEVLGPPAEAWDSYKSRVEWYVVFADGVAASVYDYKDQHIPLRGMTEWHVGGKDQASHDRIREVLAR